MKKIIKSLVMFVVLFSCFSFNVSALNSQSYNPGDVIWSDENSKIIYLGVTEENDVVRSNLTRNFTFNFLHRTTSVETGDEIRLAEFQVKHTSIYDGAQWGYDHRGDYSYTALKFPFRLVYWECTYFNGSTYLQSAYRFEVNNYYYSSGAIGFYLSTSTGKIELAQ